MTLVMMCGEFSILSSNDSVHISVGTALESRQKFIDSYKISQNFNLKSDRQRSFVQGFRYYSKS